jgi:hypothetical protein
LCPVTLFSPHALSPEHLHVERLALIGAGAIGTAAALILEALGATGELIVVDRQIFEPPNVIIYGLGTGPDAAARLPKVDIVKTALHIYLPPVTTAHTQKMPMTRTTPRMIERTIQRIIRLAPITCLRSGSSGRNRTLQPWVPSPITARSPRFEPIHGVFDGNGHRRLPPCQRKIVLGGKRELIATRERAIEPGIHLLPTAKQQRWRSGFNGRG